MSFWNVSDSTWSSKPKIQVSQHSKPFLGSEDRKSKLSSLYLYSPLNCDTVTDYNYKNRSLKKRGHPDLNRGPIDLQSIALPLSYTPIWSTEENKLEVNPTRVKAGSHDTYPSCPKSRRDNKWGPANRRRRSTDVSWGRCFDVWMRSILWNHGKRKSERVNHDTYKAILAHVRDNNAWRTDDSINVLWLFFEWCVRLMLWFGVLVQYVTILIQRDKLMEWFGK